MNRERALFITRHALESGREASELSAYVTGMLRDYAARGYRILVVTDRLVLGDRTFETPRAMLQALRNVERNVLPVTDVVLVARGFEPAPFWDAARRYNLSLEASTYVTLEGELGGAARNAGIDRIQAYADLLDQVAA